MGSDPAIAKKILLSMALKRENPRSAPQVLPGEGHVIQEGFFWAHYPPLEFVLKKNMAEYYELSTKRCQSTQQQAFNNYMVLIVRGVAENGNLPIALRKINVSGIEFDVTTRDIFKIRKSV